VLLLALASSGASVGCRARGPRNTRVARALEVRTGVAAIDADLARVRSMQITVNEAEREYLETLAALATRLGPAQDAELTALTQSIRRAADELRTRGKMLILELDVTAAEAAVNNGDPSTGCDRFAQPANVHRCQSDLARMVRVVFHERSVTQAQSEDDPNATLDVDPRTLPPSTEAFATASAVAIAELAALRLRLGAVATDSESVRDRLRAASAPGRYASELRDAIEFLEGVAARARVARRQTTTAAEAIANGAQRAAQ
jgi:hypothetical protein